MSDGSTNTVGESDDFLDPASEEVDDVLVEDYDIVSSPNDWNFTTIVSFIESGAMKIPQFQRNYIWDRKRASKLIESLLIGLPVPQVFLYEEARNSFLVIDGQQRLLTLYFYARGRFPRSNVRGELRDHLQHGFLDDDMLQDDTYFEPFKLSLPKHPTGAANRFHGLTYAGLKEDKTPLDLRTIRNIVVKQTSPEGNSAVFEIFNRLNTGSVNLTPQEIRASLYHSEFFTKVIEFNSKKSWRNVVGTSNPDARMRDTEFLLRSLALARSSDGFSGSMANFINNFCIDARGFDNEEASASLQELTTFLEFFPTDQPSPFLRSGRFSGVLFESAFAAWVQIKRGAKIGVMEGTEGSFKPVPEKLSALALAIEEVKVSNEFADTLQEGSTKPVNTRNRIAVLRQAIEVAV